jgi:TfoX/Sxy family transcriptional regulator of competence genes
MANDPAFVEYVADQMAAALSITHRMMFGGHTIYSNSKVVALVCDDQLFVKPTVTGRAYIGDVTEAPPYPGAKNSLLIDDRIDDKDWLSGLIIVTEKELPKPKPKRKKKARSKQS